MQACELAETLDELERSGVAGTLLSTFVTPGAHTDDDPAVTSTWTRCRW